MADNCFSYTNTGAKDCKSRLKQTKLLFFYPLIGSDGTKNKITLANAKLLSAWVAKFNAEDKRDRVYPTPLMDNVGNERAASEFETLANGVKIKLRKGQRTFIAYFVQAGFEGLKQWEGWENARNYGFIGADVEGNLWYKKATTGTLTDLYPIAIQDGSLDTGIVMATDTTSEKVMIQFDVAAYEKDSCFKVLAFDDLTDFNPLTDSYGLKDATVTGVSATTTTVVVDVADLNGFPVENLVTADFVGNTGATGKVYNVTDAGDVTATAAESTTVPGRYTLTFLAQTSTDVISVDVKKNGYEVTAGTQVIP